MKVNYSYACHYKNMAKGTLVSHPSKRKFLS